MHFRSITWLASAPLLVAIIAITHFYYGEEAFIYVLIPVISLIALHTGREEIDHWWRKMYPVPLDEKTLHIVQDNSYFSQLNDTQKTDFKNRLSNYLQVRDFKMLLHKEKIEVPYDVKVLIAMECIKMTFGHDDYLLGDYDRIYFYKHPFPSPIYKYLHNIEVESNDQVILLNLPMSIDGILKPNTHFNLALQAYLEAYCHVYKAQELPITHDIGWAPIEEILIIDKAQYIKITGHETANLLALHMHCYFKDKEKYRAMAPLQTKEFEKTFNQ